MFSDGQSSMVHVKLKYAEMGKNTRADGGQQHGFDDVWGHRWFLDSHRVNAVMPRSMVAMGGCEHSQLNNGREHMKLVEAK